MAVPPGTPLGQNPTPFVGEPPFLPPSFNPTNGSIVGAAKPIYINFQRPIANQQMAQDAVHITSVPPVPGRFYWTSDTQLRWRPQDFWPAGTKVYIDAAGTKSSFTVPEQLVATIDDATHEMQVMRNGELEKTIPVSMGKSGGGHTTPNGTYYVLEKFPHIVMDSSTYGVPVNSANGYKTDVDLRGPDRQQRQLRAQRAMVGRRSRCAERQPRVYQHQPCEREMVLRQLRQRRSDRGQELAGLVRPA